jgi:hypothetical protein
MLASREGAMLGAIYALISMLQLASMLGVARCRCVGHVGSQDCSNTAENRETSRDGEHVFLGG